MTSKPRPPPHLNKEHTRVWVGWCVIGDREVAREAAAKGIYIPLALEFIATRKEWDHSDVERWFRTEILSWVYQLIEQKQIFKASHILLNIGIEPSEQLSIILTETCNKGIRNYIAEHLFKNGNLSNDTFNNWKFIQCIENNNNEFNVFDDVSQISIQKFEQKSLDWKEHTAAILFFNIYDFHLETFLTSQTSWHILLSYEKLDILKLWINVYFSQNTNYELKCNIPSEIYSKLKNLFQIWEINTNMINEIKNTSYNNTVRDFVLFELSKFGIFLDEDKTDIPKIVSRFSKSQNIDNIFNILENPNSCLNINDFYEKLNDFCIKNKFLELLSVCPSEFNVLNDKTLLLWLRKKETVEITEDFLLKNITAVLSYFSDNTNTYLENSVILIALILFTNTKFYDILTSHEFTYDNLIVNSDNIMNYFSNLPVFKNVLSKFISPKVQDSNLYDLLKKQSTLTSIFDFRIESNEIPNFSDKNLCETFGHKEKINFIYYIKQQMPSKAYKLFILDQFNKYDKINDSEILESGQYIYDLVLKNNYNLEKLISCISFLEMINFDTKKLRIIAHTSKILNINNLFINESLENILIILENKILENQDSFITTVQKHELLINFAKYNKLSFPQQYLLHCTQHDLWLEFIIFIQIYNYPIDQSLNLVQNFKNKNLIEHIYHALYFEIDSNIDLSTSISSSIDDFEHISFSQKSNFLKILIQCHKSQDPPTNLLEAAKIYKNSVFSILATCYEPDSVVINWLSWLSITTNIELNIENYSVSPYFVSQFLENVLLKKFVKTLLHSFEIFMNENPLYFLVKFVYNCVFLNFKNCMEYLIQFEKLIKNLNFNTQLIENDFEYTYLTNSYWLINTGLKLIFATLNCFNSKENQIKFLHHLCKADFARNVPINYPNFWEISQLLQNISSDIQIDLSKFLNTDNRKEEIVKSIEALVYKKQYKDALQLAKFENICKEYILIQEWTANFESKNFDFFENSNLAFQNAEILPSSAAEFYVYCCTELADNSAKYTALKLAYQWLKKSKYIDQFTEQVEKEIWLNYFSLTDEILKQSNYEKTDNNFLLFEILKQTSVRSKFDEELNEIQKRHFEETLGKILEAGDFVQALRLEKIFGLKHPETEILQTCYELAEGKLKPYEISTEQRLLFLNRDMNLKNVPFRRRTVKSMRTSIGSYDSLHSILTTIENEDTTQDTLALLETMSERLKYGGNIANKILMTYRISINVNKTYQEILKCMDSKSLLLNLNNCNNKLEIIHDIFLIFKWTKTEVTDYIFEEIQSAIRTSVYNNSESVYMWDLELDTQFHLILQLCPETTSILGKKLVSIATNIQGKEIVKKNIDMKEINIIVELLIRAHDCYNVYCNMEGIANILRKCQSLVSMLLTLKNYKFMVRLLTGIGRYTEMNYIFQILKENDQFEYLLKRNYRQNNSLKRALLKFLKKHCPKNQDLYKMVALHFTLFSEVAEIWETEAIDMTHNLIEIAKLETQNSGRNFDTELVLFTNNDSTKIILNNIMNNYTHVAEYHIHGEKLNSAMQAAKKAELLALQICLLKSVPVNSSINCILNLKNRQILHVISNDLSYPHSKILVDSYNYQTDWGSVIFKQCIINGNSEYLEDYLSHKHLNNTLAQDLTRRFLAEKNISAISVNAMKSILKRLDSVHMKYRLASELGFSDVIETLLNGSQLAYLKDTVWKKGYKQL